jgi:MSHA pilin protein MshC
MPQTPTPPLTPRPRQAGFTLVEMVVVMLLMAVITAVGAARYAARDPFAAQGVADQLSSGLRVAQLSARAQRRPVHVVLDTSPPRLQACWDNACTQPLEPPGGGAWLNDTEGLVLSRSASFSYQADGSATLASVLQVRVVSADGVTQSPTVQVEAGSGHVHQP